MAWRCYVVIFVKIGKQNHSKSPILNICARNWNRAKHFYIAYNCYEFKLIYVLIVLRVNWVKTDLSVK